MKSRSNDMMPTVKNAKTNCTMALAYSASINRRMVNPDTARMPRVIRPLDRNLQSYFESFTGVT
jgi:hypothetical protein